MNSRQGPARAGRLKRSSHWIAMAVAAATGAALVACNSGDDYYTVESGTVIQGASVVNPRDGTVQSGVNVVIDQGRIKAITSQEITPAVGVQVIDGSGKYLVPGYMDSHTHAGTSANDLSLMLAYGITSIREAGGNATTLAAVRTRNAAIEAGTAVSPEVVMLPFSLSGSTEAAARQNVRDSIAAGADYIKITTGTPTNFLPALDEAKKQGKHAAGHLPISISSIDAANTGFHAFEHLGSGIGIAFECSPQAAALRAQAVSANVPPPPSVTNARIYDANAYEPVMRRVMETHDDTTCANLAKAFVQADSWQSITLIRSRTMIFGADAEYLNNPNLKYVDKARRQLWADTAATFASTVTPAAQATLKNFYAYQLKLTKILKAGGVKMLSGTDSGGSGGWCIPGVALHWEFKEMAAAGLTPLEILQTTTVNGAEFLGRQSSMGTIEVGKKADLVLLNANPLLDSANLGKIESVFLRGRYFSRSALDGILDNLVRVNAAESMEHAQQVLRENEAIHPPHF